jgi:putative peptide zinc metalloprotease protein
MAADAEVAPAATAWVGPRLSDGIAAASLVSARGIEYMMLRSPAGYPLSYLRLTADEAQVARRMDGRRTMDTLVADFVGLSGRYAPDQVARLVDDLRRHHMLEDGADPPTQDPDYRLDHAFRKLYQYGGRWFFSRVGSRLTALIAFAGVVAFCWRWSLGDIQVFAQHDSYLRGGLILLGMLVLLIVVHEVGHGLAVKHYRCRVGGIRIRARRGAPNIGLDIRDVWLAGRRARAVTSAAGVAAVAFVAGLVGLTALFFTPLTPWAFKLGFVAYARLFIDLSPWLDRDGSRVATDLLEIPNLRARALAWMPRALRRGTRFRELDSEGRLVAGYGVLSVGWLVVLIGAVYRVYVDRVAGLLVGLRQMDTWLIALVLFAMVAIVSPLLTQTARWLAGKAIRSVEWWSAIINRREERRLAVLRGSELAELFGEFLPALAKRARWIRPYIGQELIAAQNDPPVYVVVSGEVDGWSPGDPAGTVRQRVGAGGVIGLHARLANLSSTLSWRPAHQLARHTVLLRLNDDDLRSVLAATAVTGQASVGSEPEVADLLASSPAFSGYTPEHRFILGAQGQWSDRGADTTVAAAAAGDLFVVASGQVQDKAGNRVTRGAVLGPASDPGAELGTTISGVRLLKLPRLTSPNRPNLSRANYPPLAVAAEPPPFSEGDIDGDRVLEGRLWTITTVVAVSMLCMLALVFVPGRPWAEMPGNRVQLSISRGSGEVILGSELWRLSRGGTALLQGGDQVRMSSNGAARLTFRGGAVIVLCPGTDLTVFTVDSVGHPINPRAALFLNSGQILVDTWARSPAFSTLVIQVRLGSGGSQVNNAGAARFAVTLDGTQVEGGPVLRDGALVAPSTDAPACGDGSKLPTPVDTPKPAVSETPQALPPPLPLPSTTASRPAPSDTHTGGGGGNYPPTKHPTTTKPPPPPPTTSSPTPPPPPPNAGHIDSIGISGSPLGQMDPVGGTLCGGVGSTSVVLTANVSALQSGAIVTITWWAVASFVSGSQDFSSPSYTATVNAPSADGNHTTDTSVDVTVSIHGSGLTTVSDSSTFTIAGVPNPCS